MKSVTLYTTPECRFCLSLKEYLGKLGVSFTEFNVIEELDKLDEMRSFSRGSMSVPVTVINKGLPDQKVFIGFQPDALSRELKESM